MKGRELTLDTLSPQARARFERIAAAQGVDVADVAGPVLDAWNDRWRVVGQCSECGKPLIAGELEQHTLNAHFPARLRSVARDLLELTPAQRAQVVGLFGPDGAFAAAQVVPQDSRSEKPVRGTRRP